MVAMSLCTYKNILYILVKNSKNVKKAKVTGNGVERNR